MTVKFLNSLVAPAIITIIFVTTPLVLIVLLLTCLGVL